MQSVSRIISSHLSRLSYDAQIRSLHGPNFHVGDREKSSYCVSFLFFPLKLGRLPSTNLKGIDVLIYRKFSCFEAYNRPRGSTIRKFSCVNRPECMAIALLTPSALSMCTQYSFPSLFESERKRTRREKEDEESSGGIQKRHVSDILSQALRSTSTVLTSVRDDHIPS